MSAMTYSRKIAFVAALAIAFTALLAFLIWSSRDPEGGFPVAEALSQACGELDRGHYKVTIVAVEPGDLGTIRIAEIESSTSARRMRIVYLAESAQAVALSEFPVDVERLPVHVVDIELVQIDDRVYGRDSIGLLGSDEAAGTWVVIEEDAGEIIEFFGDLDDLAAWCPTAEEFADQADFIFGWEDTPTEMDNVRRYSRQLTLTPSEGRMDIWFDEGSPTLLRHRTTYSQQGDSGRNLGEDVYVTELSFTDIGVPNKIAEPTIG